MLAEELDKLSENAGGVSVERRTWPDPPGDPPHVDAFWCSNRGLWLEKDDSLRRRILERSASERASATFATYAAMDSPDLPENSLDALQVRLIRWQTNKFGGQPFERQAFGIIEELGELDDAKRAGEFSLRIDAVGDICVYASQLLTSNRLALSSVIAYAVKLEAPPSMMSAAGKLAHVVLKRLQRIRGMQDVYTFRAELFGRVADVLASARANAGGDAYNLEEVLTRVAEHVMQRKGDMLPVSESAP